MPNIPIARYHAAAANAAEQKPTAQDKPAQNAPPPNAVPRDAAPQAAPPQGTLSPVADARDAAPQVADARNADARNADARDVRNAAPQDADVRDVGTRGAEVRDVGTRGADAGGAGSRGLGGVGILALGTFAVGTDAYVVAGFLPAMSRSLHVSESAAGQSATVFAITYAALSPVLATLLARVPRRALLVGALVVLALANLGSALAPDFGVLMATRVLAAVGAAAFTPNAGAVASSLVAPAQRARALAVVIGGLTMATALGVPLGNLAERALDWRAALGLVAVLCAVAAVGVLAVMPALPGSPPVPLTKRLAALRRPGVLAILPLTVAGIAAGYGLYAFAVPVLRALGADASEEAWLLFLYGVGAVLGNLLSGSRVDRHGPFRVQAVGFTGLTATLAAFAAAAYAGVHWLPLTAVLMVAWGAATWFQTPAQQVRLINAAPEETAVVIGLNAAALYGGIALGTALGGLLLPVGAALAITVCAGVALLCLPYLVVTRHHGRPVLSPPTDAASPGSGRTTSA
ncbi:MFS transporter [Actinomadura rupiterrae]|uniref:MFS transporter n=1 Tax=Actinomadura rupiterrae TaxID=559627 RepID=UPI0020A4F017|nr:MFS transporter [Actinomadura rupiterrae]MCP2341752.1 putative MFS family arabinose efflux permease [Actinomadura rupiterrae]